jgi:hypothetical protein
MNILKDDNENIKFNSLSEDEEMSNYKSKYTFLVTLTNKLFD